MSAAAQKLFGRLGQVGLAAAIVGGIAQSALYNGLLIDIFLIFICILISGILVDGGQRAVIFDRFAGVKEAVVGEGTHFLIPWVQRPIIFDIRSTPRVVTTITGSKGTFHFFDFICVKLLIYRSSKCINNSSYFTSS